METFISTRLGLQCRTPLRSYPLTLIPYPTPCPCTAPSQKIYVRFLLFWLVTIIWLMVDHPRNGR